MFHWGCSSSLVTHSLQKETKQKRKHTPSSSHCLTLSVKIQMKKHSVMASQCPHDKDVVYGAKLSRAQDQGLRLWQTKSSAIIVYNPVLANSIYKKLPHVALSSQISLHACTFTSHAFFYQVSRPDIRDWNQT